MDFGLWTYRDYYSSPGTLRGRRSFTDFFALATLARGSGNFVSSFTDFFALATLARGSGKTCTRVARGLQGDSRLPRLASPWESLRDPLVRGADGRPRAGGEDLDSHFFQKCKSSRVKIFSYRELHKYLYTACAGVLVANFE